MKPRVTIRLLYAVAWLQFLVGGFLFGLACIGLVRGLLHP